MNHTASWRALIALAACALAANLAHGAQTSAGATAGVQGYDPVKKSGNGGGSAITASASLDGKLGDGDVFVVAMASGSQGALRASASSRGFTTGSPATDIAADAGSSWSDTFRIQSAGRDGETGTWTGSVKVSGGTLLEFGGRAYANANVSASIDTFTGTGYNGGRIHLEDFAQAYTGYDSGTGRRGNPEDSFELVFTVPFTFNQNIDFSMSLSAFASARLLGGVPGLIDSGSARSLSDYAHTMTWEGISTVLDSSGQKVEDYSAMSTSSNFDFAVAVVPEPGRWAMLLAGLFAGSIIVRARRRGDRRADTTAAAG